MPKKCYAGRHSKMALILMILAQAPSVVLTARIEVIKASDLELQDALGQVNERVKILSFNLEGRGGNMADGRDVRRHLMAYWVKLCGASDRPEVILTQEDIGGNLPGECYTEINTCESERFWFTSEYRFGDGAKKALQAKLGESLAGQGFKKTGIKAAERKDFGAARMQNKIYVRSDLLQTQRIKMKKLWSVDLVDADMLLEEDKATGDVTKAGLNPRCATMARLEIDGQPFTVGSFHLSGGYVDDEQAIAKANDKQERIKFQNIRQAQLRKILQSILSRSILHSHGGSQVIIGGDTNGFPRDQAEPCQGGRIEFLRKQAKFVAPGAEASFLKYVTTPDEIGLGTKRVDETVQLPRRVLTKRDDKKGQQSSVQSLGRGADVCSSWMASTTVWGGQPDQFFTSANVQNAQAQVLPIGLQDTETHKPRFGKTLSDHNPVLFSCDLKPALRIAQQKAGK